ncbi:assembly of actin patch protein [Rhizina undulata]
MERPAPPPPPATEAGPPPPPPPPVAEQESPSEGSVSDDEMSMHTNKLSVSTSNVSDSNRGPPPLPPSGPPSVPSGRPPTASDIVSPTSPSSKRMSTGLFTSQTTSPTSPATGANKRASYQRGMGSMPPIPFGIPFPPSAVRPPPPPPPAGPPIPTRQSIDEGYRSPGFGETSGSNRPSDTEEEVTEYEADYDTDLANKDAHRFALKAQHGKEHGAKDDEDDTPLPSPTVSSPQLVPRTAPPPPPTGSAPPSRKGRASIDMPRGAPPQLPSQHQEDFEEEYDPYKHTAAPPQSSAPPPPPPHQPPPMTAERERRGSRSTASRQSQEGGLNRPAPGRRSVDQARPNTQHEYVAKEIDLAQNSGWWKIPNAVPPALRDRKDLSYEVEETTSTRRGGRTTVTRDIYVLYHDYSQTVITAQFERDDAENASFQQRHEQPPPQPRQDQLEEYASKFGAKLFNGAKNREGTVVGDGDPYSLVKDLFTLIPDALPSVGHRAFGALVYANLANASVQQFDEIRAGDIITFRNAKFQGHKGGLHQKYLVDVGKPEHVAVVLDWDGTKKKVRAWEQGREAKKVKVESFRVGDLRSGEVRIWRVVGRGWVGWEAQG